MTSDYIKSIQRDSVRTEEKDGLVTLRMWHENGQLVRADVFHRGQRVSSYKTEAGARRRYNTLRT